MIRERTMDSFNGILKRRGRTIETETFKKKMSKTRDTTASFSSLLILNVKMSFQTLRSVLIIQAVMKRGNIIPKLKLSNRSTKAEPIGGPLGMAIPRKKAPSAGN